MREHDVPYHVRFEIDTDVRCGHWFTVRAKVRRGGRAGVGGHSFFRAAAGAGGARASALKQA